MSFNLIIPGIYMPDHSAVVGKISGWAQEYSTGVHEFAPGEIGSQTTYKKQVDIKYRPYFSRYYWLERNQTHCQFFHPNHIDFKNVSHQNATYGYSQE